MYDPMYIFLPIKYTCVCVCVCFKCARHVIALWDRWIFISLTYKFMQTSVMFLWINWKNWNEAHIACYCNLINTMKYIRHDQQFTNEMWDFIIIVPIVSIYVYIVVSIGSYFPIHISYPPPPLGIMLGHYLMIQPIHFPGKTHTCISRNI